MARGVPFRRFADVARLAGCRGEQGRPSSCHNIDAENGDRSDLSQAQHIEACARSSHLSVSAARIDDNRPNHVWATDISYIPMARGFVYLTAVMDWFTRRILAWRLSNTMEASFWIDAVEEVLAKHGCPQIFNTD